MICRVCHKEFAPSKYHPHQQVCARPACQKQRQLDNLKQWRQNNPEYFKSMEQEGAWKQKRRHYNVLWKQRNKERLQEYNRSHRKQRNEYMREYMRSYRQKNVL